MALFALTSISILTMSSAINVICSSVSNIYSITSKLTKKSNTINIENVIVFLEKTNLQTILEIYSEMLNELNDFHSKAINICLLNIKKNIQEIEIELVDINNKRIYNDTLYFGTKWMAYTFKSNIKKLEILISKLNVNIDILKTTYSLISNKN